MSRMLPAALAAHPLNVKQQHTCQDRQADTLAAALINCRLFIPLLCQHADPYFGRSPAPLLQLHHGKHAKPKHAY